MSTKTLTTTLQKQRERVGFVGPTDSDIVPLLECLSSIGHIEIVGMFASCDVKETRVIRFGSLVKLMHELDPGVVIVDDQSMLDQVAAMKLRRTEIVCGAALRLLLALAEQNSTYANILGAIEEGVQFADKEGTIRFVNRASAAIIGVPPTARLGLNAFDVAPDGALVKTLRTGRKAFGVRNRSADSHTEVLSNSSPIMVNGVMVGAVSIFQDIGKLLELNRQLSERNQIIERLTSHLEQFQRSEYTFDNIIGESKALKEVVAIARRAASSDSTVLLLGESGTGKELFAHAMHSESLRWRGPFIKVNCAAMPESLIESELFGYEKGAFTDATRTKLGKFELADKGTIFLDEIGDLGYATQSKLLRVLQFRQFEHLGGTRSVKVDVRVITATNKDLATETAARRFREDLFYRINVMGINIPPLRARKADIPLLIDHYIRGYCTRLGKEHRKFSGEAMSLAMDYPWPGNVRELENVLERLLVMTDELAVGREMLARFLLPMSAAPQARVEQGIDAPLRLADVERDAVTRALGKFGTSTEAKRLAAQALGISLATLYNRMRAYGLLNTK